MSWLDRLVRLSLPLAPRFLVGLVARRYVASDRLEQALRTVQTLNTQGAMGTLDILGEEAQQPAAVERTVAEYQEALRAIQQGGLDCNISIKPTQLGLCIDEQLCRDALARVAAQAAQVGSLVRIDMEDHTTVDATLLLYRQLLPEHGNLGVVLQSRLRRTLADVASLLPLRPNVRLCKGIYQEPRSRAWLDPEIVRQSFVAALERLLGNGCYVGIATHDERLVWASMELVDRLGLPRDRYEFQMLLGVDPELRQIILAAGHRLRVYTPFGTDWYRYSLRRLRENPTIARHVLRAMLRPRASGFGLQARPAPRLLPEARGPKPEAADQYRSAR
jgi:proline dehydrogenase